jgi:hypothetical protein
VCLVCMYVSVCLGSKLAEAENKPLFLAFKLPLHCELQD